MFQSSQNNSSQSESRSADLPKSPKSPKRKFYARSGTVRLTILAISAEVAALRFVQFALQDSLISGRKPVDKNLQLINANAVVPLMKQLDSKISISEAGFSRSEAGEFATTSIVARWRLQIAKLEQLIRSTA